MMANGKLHIGQFIERIFLESKTISTNANTGEQDVTWAGASAQWAKKETLGGSEGESNGLLENEQRVYFFIRYQQTLLNNADKYRVSYNNQYYDIESIEEYTNNVSPRTFIRIRCIYRGEAK